MRDSFGREISYMRISITDRCNLRCRYCMPEKIGYLPMEKILTYEEIITIAEQAAGLGVRYIKITGGEPLLRKGCCELVGELKKISGIEKVTLTTNGIFLGQYLEALLEAGLDGVNVSLDTLNRERYRRITGSGQLDVVCGAVEKAVASGLHVKINAVSLALYGFENDWQELVRLTEYLPLDVRFIEIMPIGYGRRFPGLDHRELLRRIKRYYPELERDVRSHGAGPAIYYKIPGFAGSIGFISAIHGKFCEGCNRVRLTSQGYLKTCLCYDDGVDLQRILRAGFESSDMKMRLQKSMREAIYRKPEAHCFERIDCMTEPRAMVMIGG